MSEELKACRRNEHLITHGHTTGRHYSPTYSSWQSMLARCRYSHRHNSSRYKNAGVSVCEEWHSFESFLDDMGERPDGCTLDRIDSSGDYCKENCRWADPVKQARNRANAKMTFDRAFDVVTRHLRGERVSDIAKLYGCSESLPREIVKGRCWRDAREAAIAAWNRRAGE